MKNLLLVSSLALALSGCGGGGGSGASPVQEVPVVPVVPVVVAPVALFATTPQLLPDLKAKYDALCGNQVSVQNAIPANLTGHTDGKKDLLFNLWCGQVGGTLTNVATPNGMIALIQQADGSFVDGTRTLFGVDMVDLAGVGSQAAVYDFNRDGKDDIVFVVTGEDGRSEPQGYTGNNRQNVFLTSKPDGTYSVEHLGPFSYSEHIMLVDNELGGKDVVTSTIGYGGQNQVWRYSNGWLQLPRYDWISSLNTVFFKRTLTNYGSEIAVTQSSTSDMGLDLYSRANGTAWTKSSNWTFPNVQSEAWLSWQKSPGMVKIVTLNEHKYVGATFEHGCELRLKSNSASTITVMMLTGNEITNGYTGGTIIESSSYLKPISKLLGFSVENNVLKNVNLPIENETQDIRPLNISCGDLNGDGSDDILVMPWGANAVPIVYLNDGSGNFSLVDTSKLPLPSTDFRDSTMIYADINGDGIRDLLYWPLTALSGNPSKVQYQIFKGLRAALATDKK